MTEGSLPKADLARRAGALFVDLLVVAVLFAVLGLLGPVLGAAYVAFRDGLEAHPFRGRSLGKAALGLTVATQSGTRCDARCSLARNWVFAVPCALAVIPVLGWIACPVLGFLVLVAEGAFVLVNPVGKRFGDELAGTQVVASSEPSAPGPARS